MAVDPQTISHADALQELAEAKRELAQSKEALEHFFSTAQATAEYYIDGVATATTAGGITSATVDVCARYISGGDVTEHSPLRGAMFTENEFHVEPWSCIGEIPKQTMQALWDRHSHAFSLERIRADDVTYFDVMPIPADGSGIAVVGMIAVQVSADFVSQPHIEAVLQSILLTSILSLDRIARVDEANFETQCAKAAAHIQLRLAQPVARDRAIAIAIEEIRVCGAIGSVTAVDLTTPTPQIIASHGDLTIEQIMAAHQAPDFAAAEGLLVLPIIVNQEHEALMAVKSIEHVPPPDQEMFAGMVAAIGASASHLRSDATVESVLRNTTKQLIEAQERDRATVAADIHDGTLQQLGATAMRLELIRTRVASSDPEAVNELIDSCAAEIRTCTKDLRTLLMELRPQVLDDNGLEAALNELGNGVDSIQVTVNCLLPDNPPDVLAITIFRIVQEALNNVRKHSHASTAFVNVSSAGGEIVIEVRDDGVGFEGAASGPSSTGQHFGLLGMRDRARMLGGEFSIVGKKGAGTVVTARLPSAKDN